MGTYFMKIYVYFLIYFLIICNMYLEMTCSDGFKGSSLNFLIKTGLSSVIHVL